MKFTLSVSTMLKLSNLFDWNGENSWSKKLTHDYLNDLMRGKNECKLSLTPNTGVKVCQLERQSFKSTLI